MRVKDLARAAYLSLALALMMLSPAAAASATGLLDNAGCLSCHNGQTQKLEVLDAKGKLRPMLAVAPAKYASSVHAEMQCRAPPGERCRWQVGQLF